MLCLCQGHVFSPQALNVLGDSLCREGGQHTKAMHLEAVEKFKYRYIKEFA